MAPNTHSLLLGECGSSASIPCCYLGTSHWYVVAARLASTSWQYRQMKHAFECWCSGGRLVLGLVLANHNPITQQTVILQVPARVLIFAQEDIKDADPKAIILSGGPNSVHLEDAVQLPKGLFQWCEQHSIPVLGICYGLQLMVHVRCHSPLSLKFIHCSEGVALCSALHSLKPDLCYCIAASCLPHPGCNCKPCTAVSDIVAT